MLKGKHHIPTEEYGFTEIEVEGETIEDILASYPKRGGGLSEAEFREVVNEYNETGSLVGGVELYNKMNSEQKFWIQTQKKYFKRTNKE